MNVFVARQPIFDRQQNVYGYELLFRAGDEERFDFSNGDKASLSVIMNTMLHFGVGPIANGKKIFINFTRNLLLSDAARYLPKKAAVIEILEDVVPEKKIVDALRQLKGQGYTLALDDYTLKSKVQDSLLELVHIVKVDLMNTSSRERQTIAERCSLCGTVELLAEKTETPDDFEESLRMGYSFFQGYFFSKPVLLQRKVLSTQKVISMEILNELSKNNLDFDALQRMIMQDPSVTYTLFKYINSTFFGIKHEVTSIKQALSLLGELEIKKWVSLAVLMQLAEDQPDELLKSALLRARFCEKLGARFCRAESQSELFLMGLFSYMDVLLGRPLQEVLEEVPLAIHIKNALLGGNGNAGSIFRLVLNYERGNWNEVLPAMSQLEAGEGEVLEIYAESLQWASRAFAL